MQKRKVKPKKTTKASENLTSHIPPLTSQKGITLIALIITIIVMLILLSVTVSTVMNGGLFGKAGEAAEKWASAQQAENELAAGNYINDILDQYIGQEIPTGGISFGNITWNNGEASITVSTTETEYQIQYQKNGIEGSWTEIENGGSITGLQHGDIVYARIYKGTNYGEQASIDIKDETKPTVEVAVENITSNSAKLTVTASDGETGLATEDTYKYYLGDELKVETTGTSYTYEGLQYGIKYTLKVVVTDKVGNETTKTAEVETTEISGGTVEGAITFGNTTWTGVNEASVTVSTNTSYKIAYQKNGVNGEWTEIANGGTITGLAHNDTVYACLYDGTNYGDYTSIDIKDETDPTVEVAVENITSNSATLNVTASDGETGLATEGTYKYYLGDELKETSTNTSYTYTGLEYGIEYTLKVVVTDKEGNETEKTATVQVTAVTSGLEEGAITFGNTTWSNGTASVTVSTNTSYKITYQKNGINGTWTEIANNGTISGLNLDDTVYACLYDGTNYGDHASVTIEDKTVPAEATISLSGTTVNLGNSVTATVTHSDSQSGIEIGNCKWVYTNSGAKLGITDADVSKYNGGTFSSNGEQITLSTSSAGTYYLHVLSEDKAGNRTEKVSDAVTVTNLVTGISLDKTTASVNVGSTTTIKATVTPSTAANTKVNWTSNNTSIATVDSNGVVTGKASGTATITATAADGSGVKATCSVTVNNVAVTGISVSPTTATLNVGDTKTLTATISPSNATNQGVTWTSSNTSVATVSSSGVVTAKGGGTATITAKASGNTSKTATCTITVAQQLSSAVSVGDYVDYTPDTASSYSLSSAYSGRTSDQTIPQESLKWRVLSINADGTVDIVSETPTTTYVYFQGALGYNNGVYLLNDICKKQYSNSTLGTTARSINLEDIESKMNSTGISARNAYNNGNKTYGETQTYSGSYAYAPDLYMNETHTTAGETSNYYSSPTTSTYTQQSSLTVKNTYYYFSSTPSNYFDDTTFHTLIFGTGSNYWLASRYANCYSSYASFGLRGVSSAYLFGGGMFNSDSYAGNGGRYLRPVVSLGSNIQAASGSGTSASPWTLSKN